MSLIRLTVVTLTLVTLSLCNLRNDDIDEGAGTKVSSLSYSAGGRAAWRRALGYKQCDADIPKRVSTKGVKKVFSFHKGSQPKPLPDICTEFECPTYEELNTTGCGYGARKIKGTTWVTTTFDMMMKEASYMQAFWRLFMYISGKNDAGVKIPMTVPVLTQVFLDADYQPRNTAYLSFYLSSDYQTPAPAPLDTDVEINVWDEDVVIYYRAFGGSAYPTDKDWEDEFTKLYTAVSESGKQAWANQVLTAGYTRPGFGQQRWEAIYMAAEE